MKKRRLHARALLLGVLTLAAGCDAFMSSEQRVERARQAVAAGDYRRASIDLRTALQEDGNNAAARVLMAEVAMNLSDPLTAASELRKAHQLGIAFDATAKLDTDVLLALAKFETAATEISTGKLKLPEPARSIALGRAHLGMGQYELAVDDFTNVLQQSPQSEMARAGLAEALAAQGESARAANLIAQVTRDAPSFAYGWFVQGTLAARRGQFDAAASSLQTAAKFAGGQLDAYQVIALFAMTVETNLARGNLAEAQLAQQKLAAVSGNSPLSTVFASRIALAQGKYSQAAELLQPLVARAEDFVPARFLLGVALLADGRLEQAEYQLNQVVQAQPEHIEARKLLARARLRLSRGSDAMEVLIPALDSEPEDATLAGLAAAASLQTGDKSGAIDILQRTVAQQPTSPEPYIRFALALMGDKQFQRAADVLERMPAATRTHPQRVALLISAVALQSGPAAADRKIESLLAETRNDVGVMNVVAAHYMRRGEHERAKATLGRILASKPQDVPTLLHAARLHEATGSTDPAREFLQRALAADPNSLPARLEIARLVSQSGDAAGAVRVLEQGLTRTPNSRPLQLALVRQYFLAMQASKAEQVVRNMLRAEPQSPELNFALGQLYSELGTYDQALARLLVASAAVPQSMDYKFAVARTRLALGQIESARLALNQILQVRPDWTPAVATVAFMEIREGRASAALERAKGHTAKLPTDPAPLVLLGDVQMAMRSYPDASESYARAAALRDSAAIAVKEARARQLAGHDNIEASLLRWLGRHPEDLAVRGALAEVYSSTGRTNRAIAEYELLVAQRPADAMALNNLAWLYFESGDARAVKVAQRAYQLAADVASIADTYGWILTHQGKEREAVNILQKAEAASGGRFEIAYHHAVALAKIGEVDAARQKLATLLKSRQPSGDRVAAEQLLAELAAQ